MDEMQKITLYEKRLKLKEKLHAGTISFLEDRFLMGVKTTWFSPTIREDIYAFKMIEVKYADFPFICESLRRRGIPVTLGKRWLSKNITIDLSNILDEYRKLFFKQKEQQCIR